MIYLTLYWFIFVPIFFSWYKIVIIYHRMDQLKTIFKGVQTMSKTITLLQGYWKTWRFMFSQQ